MAKKKELDKDEVIEALALRTPDMTMAAIARKLGCTPGNIYYYQRQYPDEILAIARQNLAARIPAIYQALADKAEAGNIPAIKLVLEHLNMMEVPVSRPADYQTMLRIVARFTKNNEEVREMIERMKEKDRQAEAAKQARQVQVDL